METDNTANAVPAIPVHSKPIRKARPTTVYRQAIRTVRKAAELVGGIDGCEEAQGQLEGFADQLHLMLEAMKAAGKAGKKKAAAEAKTGEAED